MIEQALTLPCGHCIANRLCKSAMTEGLADAQDRPTLAHHRLYGSWAQVCGAHANYGHGGVARSQGCKRPALAQ